MENTPTVPPETIDPPGHSHGFSFHGEGGTLLGIQVVNLLLTIITLGFYHYWAKTRVRHYIWGQSAFSEDRFAFHGTGEEIFIGWLKVIGLFGMPFMALQNAPVILGLDLWAQLGGLLLSMLLLLCVFPVALVGSRRYRLTRTSWRGIRFSFRGKVREYARIFFACVGYLVITLGFYRPYFDMRTADYLWKHTRFGDREFGFDGKGADLILQFILTTLLAIPTLGLTLVWYKVLKTRYLWEHTTFGEARFKSSITFGGLFEVYVVNFLTVVFTLGIAYPWAVCRTHKYYLDHLTLEGPLDPDGITQQAQTASAFGEEMGDFLDFDLDLG